MPSATVLTAREADLCRHRSHPKPIRSTEADPLTAANRGWRGATLPSLLTFLVRKCETRLPICFSRPHVVKKKKKEAFKSRVTSLGRTLNFSPLSHASFIISVYFARRLKVEELRRSSPRLCNRHRRVSCGWIHSPGAVGHDTDVQGLSVLPSE